MVETEGIMQREIQTDPWVYLTVSYLCFGPAQWAVAARHHAQQYKRKENHGSTLPGHLLREALDERRGQVHLMRGDGSRNLREQWSVITDPSHVSDEIRLKDSRGRYLRFKLARCR